MRNCFLSPIPEIEEALTCLQQAADAFLDNDVSSTRQFLVAADIPKIAVFYKSIAGKTDPKIHWQTSQPRNLLAPSERVEIRMPPESVEISIFLRDGWRCRYCGTRVISRKARSIFIKQFPDETHWVNAEYKRHTSLHSQAASLDHILPHSRGGDNSKKNLVTACGPCQFGRNRWTLEEVGFTDPRNRQPVVDGWDGLMRLHNVSEAQPNYVLKADGPDGPQP